MNVEFKGIDKLVSALKDISNTSDLQRIIDKNTKELEVRMKRAAKFKKGYETGATRDSIESEIKFGRYTGVVRPTTPYAQFLINGTRYMEAQDFLRPALYEQRNVFLSDIDKMFR